MRRGDILGFVWGILCFPASFYSLYYSFYVSLLSICMFLGIHCRFFSSSLLLQLSTFYFGFYSTVGEGFVCLLGFALLFCKPLFFLFPGTFLLYSSYLRGGKKTFILISEDGRFGSVGWSVLWMLVWARTGFLVFVFLFYFLFFFCELLCLRVVLCKVKSASQSTSQPVPVS